MMEEFDLHSMNDEADTTLTPTDTTSNFVTDCNLSSDNEDNTNTTSEWSSHGSRVFHEDLAHQPRILPPTIKLTNQRKLQVPNALVSSRIRQRITICITPRTFQHQEEVEIPRTLFISPPNLFELQGVPKYHFTRYFVRQLLVICRIKTLEAEKIASEAKYFLKSSGLFHITQLQLEEILITLLERNGIIKQRREIFQHRLEVVSRFTIARGSLVVIVTGIPTFGRPIVSMKLSERLNIPNVIRTSVVANVLSYPVVCPSIPDGENDIEILAKFKSMCAMVNIGLKGDLEKAGVNGKSVLIEGLHIDPNLYFSIFPSPAGVPVATATDVALEARVTNLREEDLSVEFGQSPKYPVIKVPFLLVGPVDTRRVRQASGDVEATRAMKALEVIEKYLLQYKEQLNVIHIDSPDVSEKVLDEMHQVVLGHLEQHFKAGAF